MENLYVVEKFLSDLEIRSLQKECDKFNSRISADNDRSNLGLAIDLFEDFNLSEDHVARRDPESYFNARWKNDHPSDSKLLQNLILSKLPSLVKAVCSNFEVPNNRIYNSKTHSEGNYLFNEHYVVKEANNGIAFRWHCDGEEQLIVSNPNSTIPKYYSVWCPLDNVNLDNGTLMVPSGTNIHKLEFSCSDSTLHGCESEDQQIIYSSSHKRKFECEMSDVSQKLPFDIDYEDSRSIPFIFNAGTAVIFSSTLWHKSPSNQTNALRRVYYSQYSSDVICPNSLRGNNSSDDSESVVRVRGGEHPLCFAVKCSPYDMAFQT